MSDLICVLGGGFECLAKTPEACLCRQMPAVVYRRERHRLDWPPCNHSAWRGMDADGRCCPVCGHFMVDFGD